MVFNGNSDKDQPRPTLKNRVQSRIQTVLLPRRHIQSGSVILPSVPQSECSTLVDFAIDSATLKEDNEPEEAETEEYVLEDDNSAWSNGQYKRAKATKKYGCMRISYVSEPVSQDALLDADNTAWVAATRYPTQSIAKGRTWFAAVSKQSQGTMGCQPEMLDPEDRAWM
ncbi:hypothetical protein ONZ51_g8454 [Trametes cubensis]|uniref:Uncharacterized protein n=1 Tax=Trametes cubensis TaxID=1111947 RepID=A0AAD7TNK2_9APHY|nr:hypothetical protein ONZ51_g8454 [Trametes cubensis]